MLFSYNKDSTLFCRYKFLTYFTLSLFRLGSTRRLLNEMTDCSHLNLYNGTPVTFTDLSIRTRIDPGGPIQLTFHKTGVGSHGVYTPQVKVFVTSPCHSLGARSEAGTSERRGTTTSVYDTWPGMVQSTEDSCGAQGNTTTST